MPSKHTLRTLALCALAFALTASSAACGDDDSDDDGAAQQAQTNGATTSANAGTTSTNAGTTTTTVQSDPIALCAEADFAPSPFMGPGFDEAGQPVFAPEGDYIISATALLMRPEPEHQQTFGALMEPIMGELFANPGLVGVSLGTSQQCGTARTLAVWRDVESMMDFVTGPAHVEAMRRAVEVSAMGKTTSWSVAASDVLAVDWEVQRAQINATPRTY